MHIYNSKTVLFFTWKVKCTHYQSCKISWAHFIASGKFPKLLQRMFLWKFPLESSSYQWSFLNLKIEVWKRLHALIALVRTETSLWYSCLHLLCFCCYDQYTLKTPSKCQKASFRGYLSNLILMPVCFVLFNIYSKIIKVNAVIKSKCFAKVNAGISVYFPLAKEWNL